MIDCRICVLPSWKFQGVIENNVVRIYKDNGALIQIRDEPDFSQIQMECFENAAFLNAHGKWGFINIMTGEVMVPPIWDFVTEYHDGLAVVASGSSPISCGGILGCEYPTGGHWGCIDHSGKVIIPLEYDSLNLQTFSHRTVALARKDCLKGMVDRTGNIILPFEYLTVQVIGENSLICLEQNGTFCFRCKEDTVFMGATTIYEPINGNQRDYYIACKKRKYAVFCTDGRMLSEFSMLLREAKTLIESLCGTTKFQSFYKPTKREV